MRHSQGLHVIPRWCTWGQCCQRDSVAQGGRTGNSVNFETLEMTDEKRDNSTFSTFIHLLSHYYCFSNLASCEKVSLLGNKATPPTYSATHFTLKTRGQWPLLNNLLCNTIFAHVSSLITTPGCQLSAAWNNNTHVQGRLTNVQSLQAGEREWRVVRLDVLKKINLYQWACCCWINACEYFPKLFNLQPGAIHE